MVQSLLRALTVTGRVTLAGVQRRLFILGTLIAFMFGRAAAIEVRSVSYADGTGHACRRHCAIIITRQKSPGVRGRLRKPGALFPIISNTRLAGRVDPPARPVFSQNRASGLKTLIKLEYGALPISWRPPYFQGLGLIGAVVADSRPGPAVRSSGLAYVRSWMPACTSISRMFAARFDYPDRAWRCLGAMRRSLQACVRIGMRASWRED